MTAVWILFAWVGVLWLTAMIPEKPTTTRTMVVVCPRCDGDQFDREPERKGQTTLHRESIVCRQCRWSGQVREAKWVDDEADDDA